MTRTVTGAGVYVRPVLALYDWWVLGLSNHAIWLCPTSCLRRLYDCHSGARHLDVGVGSGYYLDRCQWPTAKPRIVLLDCNQASLRWGARRLARYRPACVCVDVRQAMPFADASFDSIGVTYVLHCLPGSIGDNAVVFDRLMPLLRHGGTLFGATVLGRDVRHTLPARALLAVYNRLNVFSNRHDTAQQLAQVLEPRCGAWGVEVIGGVALFWGRRG